MHIRGKSLLELWVTTFIPNWHPPLGPVSVVIGLIWAISDYNKLIVVTYCSNELLKHLHLVDIFFIFTFLLNDLKKKTITDLEKPITIQDPETKSQQLTQSSRAFATFLLW